MQTELITVATADGIELDGAMYRPATASPRRGASVLMVHGLTWNFYCGPSRWLPPLLAAEGYPCLSLNMRDHDLTFGAAKAYRPEIWDMAMRGAPAMRGPTLIVQGAADPLI